MGSALAAADDTEVSSLVLIDPLRLTDNGPILNSSNVDEISSVLAAPGAWRTEPAARKVAAASMRGLAISNESDDEMVDAQLEQLMDADDMVPGLWLKRATAAADTVGLFKTPAGRATGFLVSTIF